MRASCAAYPFNPDNELLTSAATEPRKRRGIKR